MRLHAAVAVVLAGCGEPPGGLPEHPRCETERRATFSELPAGSLSDATVEGIRIQRLEIAVQVQHDSGVGMIVLVGGRVALIPDCAAEGMDIVFDGLQGALDITLFPGEFGGDPILSASTSSLPVVPVDSTWDRVRVQRAAEQPRIARAELSGGNRGESSTSVALREVAFLPMAK